MQNHHFKYKTHTTRRVNAADRVPPDVNAEFIVLNTKVHHFKCGIHHL